MSERSGLARAGKEACVGGAGRRGRRAGVWVHAGVCVCACMREEVQKQRLSWLRSVDMK